MWQHDITAFAVLPWQLDTLRAASAVLPNETMLKSAAAPNTAAAVILWVMFKFVIFSSLGCDLFDRWAKFDENCLSRA